mmetsp:Transcript_4384/g.4830  ORF Transcript_4384/g.4830 Transcript_4384/m.4830 type:complete len:592 (+) Transcript_4384:196-1971(+)
MTDTTLHELCKGFGALLSRSKLTEFPIEASNRNNRGNLPLHAACSFQPTPEVVEVLIKSHPAGPTIANNIGNLPLHQAAMWQASAEVIEVLLDRHPDAATVRNQYGSLPLHMAASNQAKHEIVKLLIDAYPEALQMQNDDGMTPLDLAMSDESSNDSVVALLQGRPMPPELTPRQQAERYAERADALEKKLGSLRGASGQQKMDLSAGILAVRRLADRFPHSLYSAGVDPNTLEIALSEAAVSGSRGVKSEDIILDAVKRRLKKMNRRNSAGDQANPAVETSTSSLGVVVSEKIGAGVVGTDIVRDSIEELLGSIVGLDHLKSQVRGLRRTTEISDLRESLLPSEYPDERPRASHMVFIGNPGVGKTTVARLLAKIYHELGIIRKPKFVEVERMDMVGRSQSATIAKTRDVIDEAKGGILFIDEAFTLGLSSKKLGKSSNDRSGQDAIAEILEGIDKHLDDFPLVVMAGFQMEMQQFLSNHSELKSRFPLTFEFPDYTCVEIAKIFSDLAYAKGFDLEEDITVEVIGSLLQEETTEEWRSERNGRVGEMLLAGSRGEVRKRMRAAAFEGEEIDPHIIVMEDVENVVRGDFK